MELFSSQQIFIVILLIAAWTLPWKAVALWRAARNRHTAWFVALLLINTAGVLEIVYIMVYSKTKNSGNAETGSKTS